MSTKMQIDRTGDDTIIDEGLYSRQLYVLGHEAMKRIGASSVLIVGLNGLGCEIAKNVILAGVKSVTLYDPTPVQMRDLSTQFYLRESDIGAPRDAVSCPRLAELNAYVPVNVLAGPLTPLKLAPFKVVVFCNTPIATLLEMNDFTHKNGISFISTSTHGLFGSLFCDFGPSFMVNDQNGENPITGMISSITPEGTVTMLEEGRHGLEDGDVVTFEEVVGLDVNKKEFKVEVKTADTFSIGSVEGLGKGYVQGGIFTQVKVPKEYKFKSLRESLDDPEYLISDFAKFDRPAQLHLGFQALDKFFSSKSHLPRPHNAADAAEILAMVKEYAAKAQVEIDDKLIQQLAFQAQGDLSPMVAVFGGWAAQEVLKAVSGKFGPTFQWLYLDSLESLPTNAVLNEETCKPIGSRYDGQIMVFGKEFHERLTKMKQFLVGAGAIGCEMLKNWAMMGVGTGGEGVNLAVTDMDSIEKSNLNRQFLFRPPDVGKLKSETAVKAVQVMNPELAGKFKVFKDPVGPDTEAVFGHDFFEPLDVVVNALDNVEARTYVDRRCVFFRKPLLESGTLGTKGNTQVVYPFLTESYSSSQDPPEKSFPMCTIKSFPNQIEHTIAWAKEKFEELFQKPAENVNLYLSQPNFLESTLRNSGNQLEILQTLQSFLVTERPLVFEECIIWARLEFEKRFTNEIQQLLYNFPKDSVTSSGHPFWSGPKRCPTPVFFDWNDEEHVNFIVSAAQLHAANYGLNGDVPMDVYKKTLDNLIIPEFSPRSGVKIQVSDTDTDNAPLVEVETDELVQLADSLPPPSSLAGYRLSPIEFEKDFDLHVEFVTSASNLRARNYGIQRADKHKTKFVAGKIVPAIATTTSLVTGLICLELYKIADGKNDLDSYKNGFVNLALPLLAFSSPIESPKLDFKKMDKIWDRFDVNGKMTLKEFLAYFEREKGLKITMLSCGVTLLYNSFFAHKQANRMNLTLPKLVEFVGKKPIAPHQKDLIFEICADDEEGEDVEVPFVRVDLRTA